MSAGHLSRQFRLAYGESPYAYLMTRRIEHAMALLRRGDLSVTVLGTKDLDGAFDRLQASDAEVVQEPTEGPRSGSEAEVAAGIGRDRL
jgi:AraC-like DNA-binding protein